MLNKNEVHHLLVPFSYSGVLYQARVHVENMLPNMSKDNIRALWDEARGLSVFFSPVIDDLLSPQEKIAKQTLTLLWQDAIIQNLTKELQEVLNELLDRRNI